MMELLLEWWQYGFMRNAFFAVLLIMPLFALLGTMVVNNGMAFFSDALGHSALTGVGIGVLLGLSEYSIAIIAFAIVFALLMNRIRHSRLSSTDTVIGVFSSCGVALGLVILSRGGGFAQYQSLLIGDILSITERELVLLAVTLAVTAGLLLLLIAATLMGKDRTLRAVIAGAMAALVLSGGVFQGWLDRGKAVFALPEAGAESCVVLVQDGRAAVLSCGGYQTGAVCQILQRHNVREVTALCLPDRSPDAREAAAQVLEEYGAGALVLPEGAYLGRDLELALGDTLVGYLSGGQAFDVLPGVTARILPRWEGLRLTVHGVEVLVEWERAQAQSCGVLLTNQEESRVNSSLSVWQTDAIIGENGQGWAFSQPGEATVLAVEDGCLAVEITPAGAVTARRES